MNKKITVQREDKKVFYCILSADKDLCEQLNAWLLGEARPRHGLCVNFDGTTIDVVDYFHNEKMASFKVLKIEDTNDDLLLGWAEVNVN